MSESAPFSLLSAHDSYLFNEGSHFRLYDKLGARVVSVNGTNGCYFAVMGAQRRTGFARRRFQWLEPIDPSAQSQGLNRNLGNICPRHRQGHLV